MQLINLVDRRFGSWVVQRRVDNNRRGSQLAVPLLVRCNSSYPQ